MRDDFREYMREDRRLVILRLLSQAEGYRANIYLLHAALPGRGHNSSQDAVQGDIDWLHEQGLVTAESVGGVTLATLTGRGDDVQAGRVIVTGVKRPRPE